MAVADEARLLDTSRDTWGTPPALSQNKNGTADAPMPQMSVPQPPITGTTDDRNIIRMGLIQPTFDATLRIMALQSTLGERRA